MTYNSQGGNGLLGWGWTLGGLSAISRVTENLFLDGMKKSVNFDDDRFALDGQRLMAIEGVYGSNLAEYRTEVDGMSKIVSYTEDSIVNGPAKFKVWTADGLIMEYGFTPKSKIAYKCKDDDTKYEVALWLLNRVEDREGNYMTYEYGVGGAHYFVREIKYTGNASANLYPRYVLTFGYEHNYPDYRRDKETTFIGNHTLHQSTLLKSVSINWQVHRPWKLEEIARYDFSYYAENAEDGFHYHRLKDIAYSRGGVSYNKTVVDWGYNDYSISPSNLIVPVSTESEDAFSNKVKYTGDFNGDGFKDIIIVYTKNDKKKKYASVYLNDGLSNGTSSYHFLQEIELDIHTESLHVADLDGDGRDDMVTVSRWPYLLGWAMKKVRIFPFLTKWTSSGEWKLDYAEKTWDDDEDDLCIGSGLAANLMIGDFLGNGKTDMVMQIPNGAFTIPKLLYITYEGGNTFAMKRTDELVLPGEVFVAADFNGDGITEIWCDGKAKGQGETDGQTPEDRSYAAIYKMTSKSNATQFNTDYVLTSRHHILLGDFNGDGKSDILSYVKDSKSDDPDRKSYRWQINYFMETELSWPVFDITDELPNIDPEERAFEMFDSPFLHLDYQHFEVTDMDGDGKSDFVVAIDRKLYVFYGPLVRVENEPEKARFSHKQSFDMREIGLGNMVSGMTMCSGNFLGRENVGIMGNTNIFILPSMTNRYSVEAITDGMGNVTKFEYDYLTTFGSDIYHWSRWWNQPEYDIFSMPFSMKALKRVSSYNPRAGTPIVSTVYGFNDAYIHRMGKGVLGFRRIVSKSYIDGQRFDSVVSHYSPTPLMAHRALSMTDQSVYNALNRLVSKDQFENAFLEHYSNCKSYVPIVTRKWSRAYNPDNGNEEIMSIALTENHYRIDAQASHDNGSTGLYYNTVKLTDTYEGISPWWMTHATDGQHITHTQTFYQPDSYIGNWIINRPDSTMVTAWKNGDDRVSKSLITYRYRSNTSYLVECIESYPGGNRNNANRLATATNYKYDIVGNVTNETLTSLDGFPAPRSTTYTYQEFLFPKTETNAMGYVSETHFNMKFGELLYSKDCNGQTTYYNRSDHLGSTEWVKYPDLTFGCTAKRWARHRPGFYDSDSPRMAAYYTWKRISGEKPVKVFFDAAGRELRTVTYGLHGETIYQDTEYNSMGLVKCKSLPYFPGETKQWTSYYYDGLLRPTDTYFPDGTHQSISYDGFTTASTFHATDGETRTSSETTNYLGQKTKSVDALGTEVQYFYYPDGKLKYTQIGDDPNTRIKLEYDDAGNRTKILDPNYGLVTETYDAFGQLRTSLTPKGDLTEYDYDNLGRCFLRVETDEAHHTATETHWIYSGDTGQKGLLQQVIYGENQTITYNYDAAHLNRLSSKTERLFGTDYTTTYTYDDEAGFPLRVQSVTYPTGFETRNVYDPTTSQRYKIEDAQGNALWETLEKNALGQVTRYATGNGVESSREYSPTTGRLQGIYSVKNQNILQNLGYEYDDFGNLAARYDKMKNLRETFGYDELDRLDSIWLNGVHTGLMTYDALGRMTGKMADGQQVFGNAQYGYTGPDGQLRPHAVSSAETNYDPFPTDQLDIDYTMFDKVRRIISDESHLLFDYGYDHQRVRMRGTPDSEKVYVGNCEFVSDMNGTSAVTYLIGPLGVFAVNTLETGGCHFVNQLHYVYKDHLGSWTTITNANGTVEQEQSFDAWGNMRNPDTWTGTVTQQPMFDRGYTGHEHLNSFGLINMNGRMYDPVMSSFLSVDNYVQCPDLSQNFNRYAYCLNNPLKYTDPSGEIPVLAVVAIGAAVTVIMNGINNVRHGENFFHGAGPAAVTGGMQAFFAYGIGECAGAFDILFKSEQVAQIARAGYQIVAHGTVGGVATWSRGGNFWQGFVSTATASVISGAIGITCTHYKVPEAWAKAAMIAGGAISGGISAEMAGGDFIDGFCNGLISAGLNHALHFTVKHTPKIVKVLHELKNFENVMQKDRGPRLTSHFKMCKYAVMEAIAKYSGVSNADQWDYKDTGERFINWEKANNRPEPLLSSVFEKCGFSVDIVPEDRVHEFWPKALDNGKPVVFDYMADDNTRHTATLMALGRDAGGNLMYRLADPMLGVYECQAAQIQVNASYVFYVIK